MTETFLTIAGAAMLAAVLAAFLPWNVKAMMDTFRAATRREFEIKDEKGQNQKTVREMDYEEALHLVLQWRFKTAALFLGFAAIILVCTTIILVCRPPNAVVGASTEKSQESKAAPLINQTFNSVLTNTTSAPQ